MKAFDADILSELFRGTAGYVNRAAAIPTDEQAVPIVVVEEILRGRLNVVRQAEAGKARVGIDRGYELLWETINFFSQFQVLPYTADGGGVKRSASELTICASPPFVFHKGQR